MLARASRIVADKEIRLIFQRGRKYSTPLFRVWVYRRQSGTFRALVIASKKVSKRSTKRNLVKRRAREVLRKDIAPLLPSVDIVLEISPQALQATYADFRSALRNTLT